MARPVVSVGMVRPDISSVPMKPAVPVTRTVVALFDFDSSGRAVREEANLLGENYWNLANVVTR